VRMLVAAPRRKLRNTAARSARRGELTAMSYTISLQPGRRMFWRDRERSTEGKEASWTEIEEERGSSLCSGQVPQPGIDAALAL
jgi:hypothetical protein